MAVTGGVLLINGMISNTTHIISRRDRTRPSYTSVVVKATTIRSKKEELQPYRASINAGIEKHLHQAVKIIEPVEVVARPLHHVMFSAPRSTAPELCVAVCELIGGRREDALEAAASLRIMHAAFFAHENVELSKPRPIPITRPIVEHAYSPGVELMTGDAMIPFAFELLARSDDPTRDKSGQILQVMREIGRATGTGGMIYGQYLKKEACQMSPEIEKLVEACEYYEGVLHECAGACGAILGGGGKGEIERLRNFGGYVGKIQGLRMLKGKFEEFDMDLTALVDQLKSSAIAQSEGFDEMKVEEIISTFTKLEDLTD